MRLVGTTRANRKGIPKELVEMPNRDDKDIKFVYANEDDMMLTSDVVKKKSGKRYISWLSTMHDFFFIMIYKYTFNKHNSWLIKNKLIIKKVQS